MDIKEKGQKIQEPQENKIMLIDGNSLLFRAFYALPLLNTKEGIYTNGVYGFMTMFNRVMKMEAPTHVVVALDKERKSFRNEIYGDYKGHRSNAPEELAGQFSLLREVMSAAGIPWIEAEGFEADDIIGTLSALSEQRGMKCVIVTGDADALQLVSPEVSVLMTKKGISAVELFTPREVKEKWEVDPPNMIDIKALMGDSSDNIPGVPGIGPKTAVNLLKEFHDIENLYNNLNQVKNAKLKEKLSTYKDQAFLSYSLARIDRHIELDCKLENMRCKIPDEYKLRDLYGRLEFTSLLKKLPLPENDENEALKPPDNATIVLEDREAVTKLAAECVGEETAVFLEADNVHPMWATVSDIFIELREKVYSIHIGADGQERWGWARSFFENDNIKKYTHNAKFIQVLLLRHGIKLQGIAGDTMLLAYVDDPAFNCDQLSNTIYKYTQKQIPLQRPDLKVLNLKTLYNKILEQIDESLKKLYLEVEMPLSSCLAHMEFAGIKVERDVLQKLSRELAEGILQSEEYIFKMAGRAFNISSPKQLGEVLFEDLGLRKIKKTKTGYSTGAEVLEELFFDHDIIKPIIDYRLLSKLKSTYVDALQNLIHPDSGRVHTIFKQAQTTTGRLSSIEPNLQNIPARMEEGRKI
ncbi:MAG: DNA polymerase I, partial [Syntrophomonadaceae bacterium]|nr:DNA polymerase I [Syntrophomonadaceae bacterium]